MTTSNCSLSANQKVKRILSLSLLCMAFYTHMILTRVASLFLRITIAWCIYRFHDTISRSYHVVITTRRTRVKLFAEQGVSFLRSVLTVFQLSTVASDLGHPYWIYIIPTHGMHQWLLLQFLVLLMMDAESVRNMQSNLAVTNKQYCQSYILLVLYII
jgi:hypothetical protein